MKGFTMQPEFVFLGIVIMVFSLFASVLLYAQISDSKHRRMLDSREAPSTERKRRAP